MRIHVMSDLHLEFGKMPRDYQPPDCDVVVLAGDIASGLPGIIWATERLSHLPVIYVPGNHEFYGKRVYPEHIQAMKAKAEGTNVTVLCDEERTLSVGWPDDVTERVRFLGATLWADFDLHATPFLSEAICAREMNDYRNIMRAPHKSGPHPLTTGDTRAFHMVSKFFLREALLADPIKTVVVTHHAPSEMSVPERYRDDKTSPAYASRLENLILDTNPALWIHGHIHSSSDYVIGETRVVCNPRGYVGEWLNPNFDPQLVLEV